MPQSPPGATEFGPTPPATKRNRLILPALLGATIIGTLSNNSLNVPLRTITAEFHAQVSAGVLVVSSFVLVLAAAMPLMGWVGDRVGRRRTLTYALILMAAAQIGAALTPSLPALVAIRAIQGLACSAIPPSVMGLLATIYPLDQRSRVIGAWAAANGIGQAIGAPFGGLVTDLFGWRAVFWLLVPCTVLVVAAARALPADLRGNAHMHWPGALSLTFGAFLLMTAATIVPQRGVPTWLVWVVAGAGLAGLYGFVHLSARTAAPLIRPALLIESRYLRSALAAFGQMFALSVVLVSIPLYLTGQLGQSTAVTGAIVFTLPLTMTVLAPAVGSISDRRGPRRVLRTGLIVLVAACLGIGVFSQQRLASLEVLAGLLILAGVGVALVQTPSATGATRSPAGRTGAALGLFNMARFAGSAFGAAWVAVAIPSNDGLLLYGGACVALVGAFAATFLGSDPRVEANPEAEGAGTPDHLRLAE